MGNFVTIVVDIIPTRRTTLFAIMIYYNTVNINLSVGRTGQTFRLISAVLISASLAGLAVRVVAEVVVFREVRREIRQVLVVHVVIGPLPSAQEALQMPRLHVSVKLLIRVKVLVAELASRVPLEPRLPGGDA